MCWTIYKCVVTVACTCACKLCKIVEDNCGAEKAVERWAFVVVIGNEAYTYAVRMNGEMAMKKKPLVIIKFNYFLRTLTYQTLITKKNILYLLYILLWKRQRGDDMKTKYCVEL